MLIDNIDAHLDLQSSQYILEGLKEAFPRLQIIATASQSELLETNPLYALRLDNRQLYKSQKVPPDWLHYSLSGLRGSRNII